MALAICPAAQSARNGIGGCAVHRVCRALTLFIGFVPDSMRVLRKSAREETCKGWDRARRVRFARLGLQNLLFHGGVSLEEFRNFPQQS